MPLYTNHPPLQNLFLVEAVLKVMGGSIFFFSPTTILKNLTSAPFSATSISLIRSLGTQTVAFSIPLFLVSWNIGRLGSRSSRKLVYWTLLAREGFLALGILAQIAASHFKELSRRGETSEGADAAALEEGLVKDRRGEEEDALVEERRLRKGLWYWVAELMPFVVGRLWILRRREDWF